MRLVRCAVLVVCVVLVSGGFLKGDDKKGGDKDEPKGKVSLPTHFKKLGLSDEQKDRVLKIVANYKAKLEELEKKKRELTTEEKAELLRVLTEEQKARYRELLLGEKGLDKDKKEPAKEKKESEKEKKDK